MSGINKVIIVGRVGQNPKTSFLQDGTAIASFSLATSETWKDKTTGEKKEKTTWHNCQAWRRLGEICGEYLSKGSLVYIEGKLNNRSYEKDGVTKYISEIIVSQMQMLGGRQEQKAGPVPKNQRGNAQSDDIPF